ncbi:hypothetical protein SAMN05216374_2334 [Tardiphaga sp. OK246]|uniref:hypothetical protein n=1 Tax=Tardiphaga sp. OK246 TaxID=1855307 RepID=UPI000B6D925F|nr:hypothetical protein [Tardiphaga sp. OK246]SNT02067.1 hypothetical protein SAMN05216374_2334 [Tardiphaga sp. OK246]
MSTGENDLKSACFELARTTKWSRKPIDAELLSSLAVKFEEIARGFVEESLDRDIPLIVKAVRYLNQVHALPPMDEDTSWFYNMLSVVVEIARPNTVVDERGKPFLEEMQKGIHRSLSFQA